MRYALWLAYDGTDLAAKAAPGPRRSVAGELAAALGRLGEPEAGVDLLSRTDAGVHAEGQVAVVDLRRSWAPSALLKAIARQLPDDIAAVGAAPWDGPTVVSKIYRYELDAGRVPDPQLRRRTWRAVVELESLSRLAPLFEGQRDWRGFARSGETRTDLVRTVHRVAWSRDADRLCCEVEGAGFVYRQVRSMVGAMIAVARGTCSEHDLRGALAGEPTPAGRQQAPARGLHLVEIRLDPPPVWVMAC